MYAQQGDSRTAFLCMRRALADLGITVIDNTWEQCDEEFKRLLPLVGITDHDLFNAQEESVDRVLVTIGAVLVEMLSAAYWSKSEAQRILFGTRACLHPPKAKGP